jgi:hypothetical protein
VPLPVPILERDLALAMIDARDEMLLLFPDRAPHRDIIKAAIQEPGHALLLFERSQRLADRLQRFLHGCWHRDILGRQTT